VRRLFADGTGDVARLNAPQSVVVDLAGNLLVADTGNHAIRKVTPAGLVTTLAGAGGIAGSSDGLGTAARFWSPRSLAQDPAGNVYVADGRNFTIRKILPSGLVTTLAGSVGSAAQQDGTGSGARFLSPTAVAVAANGEVSVADGSAIRRISAAGAVTTIAGSANFSGNLDGKGTVTSFSSPQGLALDAAGNLYVADTFNHTIRKVDPSGTVTTHAGGPGLPGSADGPADAVRFAYPAGIAFDASGNLFVADIDNAKIRLGALGNRSILLPLPPLSTTAVVGGTATFSVVATGPGPFNYQWRRAGVNIEGGTGSTHAITGLQASDAGLYDVVVGNPSGAVASSGALLAVSLVPLQPVTFAVQPTSQKVAVGNTVEFQVGVSGTEPITYQWRRDGVALPGATSDSLLLPSVQALDGGSYDVVVSNPVGSGTSALAALALDFGLLPPSITSRTPFQKVFPGASAIFSVTAVGTPPLSYQWRKNGVAISGGTASSYTIASVQSADLGDYSVQVTGAQGEPVVSAAAPLSFDMTPPLGGLWMVLAGTAGGAGTLEGTGPAAQFNYPRGITVDAGSNLYVADTQNHTIRRITPAGVATTFAGVPGSRGGENGQPLESRFREPQGVAIDASSNVYVADTGNHVIRKISAAGVVSTFAGTMGTPGSNDGTGIAARFKQPTRLVVDAAGNLFVTDTGNHTIRRITAGGEVSSFAGAGGFAGSTDEMAANARFNTPGDIASDGAGNLYVVDAGNKTIRKITPGGTVTTVAGRAGFFGTNDGTGDEARFGSPRGLAADPAGNLWVLDGSRIRSVSNTGVVATVAGNFVPGATDALGMNAEFFNPSGICRAPNGTLYIADTGNSVIRAADTAMIVSTFAGASSSGNADGTATAARFHSPRGAARDSVGNVYIADAGNHIIRRVTPSGVVTTVAGSGAPGSLDGASGTAQFRAPEAVAVDAAGNVFVADTGNHTLRVISPAGLVSTLAGVAGFKGSADGAGAAARFFQPRGLALDLAGNIYVSDFGNFTLRKVTSAGGVSTFAGSAGASGTANGTAGAARLSGPGALAFEASGNLLFTDANAIRRVSPSGNVSTVAGRPGEAGAIDGAASVASFSAPQGLAVDSAGLIFVADTFNHTVRRIATDGTVSTLAGAAGSTGSAEGVGTAVRFAFPWGLCNDGFGNLVLTDLDNSKVRVGLLRDTPLAIRIQPVGATIFQGASVTLSVGASGVGPLNYQWRKNGVVISGATAPQYRIASLHAQDEGQYSVVVGNIAGSVTSENAEVKLSTEVPIPVRITGQPQKGVVALGYAAVFSVTAEGSAPLRYQWRKNGTNIIGAVSASHTIASVSLLDTGSYDVLVFNTSSTETSVPVTLTVNGVGNAPPSIITQPVSVTQYPGVPAVFSVSVTGAPPLTFQWRKDGKNIDGATASSLKVAAALASDNGEYDVVVSNGVGDPVTSASATFSFTNTPPPSGMWSLLAGAPGGPGADDGPASDARFHNPQGLAYDAAGNAYVADTRNHTIRKVSPLGEVSTFAGTAGSSGALDGQGVGARFNAPQGVAVDGSGNVYVADTGNHLIRKITTAGLVSTLAGFPTYVGKADGTGSAARFNFPVALVSDAAGNLYVADRENHAIRLVSPEGVVTTPAGYPGNLGYADGAALVARFNRPGGIALRSLGGPDYELLIADTGNRLIRKMTVAGEVSTLAGGAGLAGVADDTGSAARFGNPTSLASPAGNTLYIADGNRIRRLDLLTGAVTTFAGGPAAGSDDSSLLSSAFSSPQGLALGSDGNLLVADTGNSTLRVVNPVADAVATFAGRATAGSVDGIGAAARFRAPVAAVLDSAGNLYVADAGNHTIRKVTVSGVATTFAGAPGQSGYMDGSGTDARFSSPRGLALAANGDLYVADSGNHLIRVISPAGKVATFAGVAGLPGTLDGARETARFSVPRGLAFGKDGSLYVADSFNFCIRKITSSGLVSTLAGSPGTSGAVDGQGSAARFASPVAVAVDALGNVYVADFNAIRKVTPAGVVSTFAGNPLVVGSLDGAGSAAGLASPQALALDAAGNLYVADTGNQLVRKITPAGAVSTLSGNVGWAGAGEGVGSGVRFAAPSGIAADALGNLYVVDAESARIRVGMLAATPLQIVSQPADTTTFSGSTTVFQVAAIGPRPLAYQWKKDGLPIAGADKPVLSISPVELASAGTYSVTVTNSGSSVTSRDALLTFAPNVPTPLAITSQPAGLSMVVGASGTLSVTVTGSDPTYQWRKNKFPIPGATGPQLVFSDAQFADAGGYDVVIENARGRLISNTVNLAVTTPNPGAPFIGSQTTMQKVSPGAGATFSVTVIGSGTFAYQWLKNSNEIPGATGESLTLPAVYAQDVGLYQVRVSNDGGSVLSDAAELTLNFIPPASGVWATLAGPLGGPGSLDSTLRGGARFNYPGGAALDAGGSLYIADTNNHTIRRVSPLGETTTVAGVAGSPGSVNGPAALAAFNAPSAVALDAAGNLYVADTGNHLIRKISATGLVTTIAGTANKSGLQDGTALVSRFNGPRALVSTDAGTLYIADTGNSVIRMITSGGSVSTLAGNANAVGHQDAGGVFARFNRPAGIALDAAGTLYVADTGNRVVRRIESGAVVSTLAGLAGFAGTADGTGAGARFSNPVALSSDPAGNLFVLDANRVRTVSTAGVVVTLAGDGASGFANGTGSAARFASPLGVVADSAGGAYIADTSNSLIRLVTSGGSVTTVAGSPSLGAVDSDQPNAVRFNVPRGLAQDAQGNTYVADSANHTIRKVTNSGATTTLAGGFGLAGNADGEVLSARFNGPQAVALDAAGNVYVADTGNHCVRVISTAGMVSTFAGSPGLSGRLDGAGPDARFLSPRGVALDSTGNVYVADTGNFTIRKITPAGVVTTFAGAPGASGSLDGAGSSARFTAPVALAVNASGNLVVADGSAIRSISPFGNVTTLAGVAGVRGAADGTGAVALFAAPQGVALDVAGNVYVADTFNQTIRKVSSTGVVTTLAGAAGMTGSAEGIGTVARFAYPAGICVDALGNLVVTEWDSAKVRIGALVNTSLQIRTQPATATVMVGSRASLSVTATGTPPFTYRWRKAGTLISGAEGPTFVLPSAALGDTGLYDVLIADAKEAVTSGTAQLSVYTAEQLAVTISAQPADATVLEGGLAQFSVSASSLLPLAYQWRKDGVPLAGKTSAALVLPNVALTDAGTYSVVASHAYGSATSTGAVLVVNARPPGVPLPVIETQPQNLNVNPGSPANFSVTATGPGTLSYQWRKDGEVITGGTAATFSIASAQSGDAGSYDVVVTSSEGGSVTSSTATLTVSPAGLAAPVIAVQPASASRSAGESAVFAVLANGAAPLRYQWRKNGVPIANANYLSYKILSVSAADVGNYDVVVSNPEGKATSAVAPLTVKPTAETPPSILVQPQDVTVSPGTQVYFSVGAEGTAPLAYQWYKDESPISGATSATLLVSSDQISNGGNYSVEVSNARGSVMSGTAVLTVGATVEEDDIYTWSVFAGPRRGAPGSTDGSKEIALFFTPGAVAMDKNGNLYVADTDNHTVRKITLGGVVTTLAGAAGCPGKADGTGAAARFSYPAGLAVDGVGNVYVADTSNDAIRKITPFGVVTTFAGKLGAGGALDAAGADARFDRPSGIAVDKDGNLYVADTGNHTIRKVSPGGVVTTVSGRAGTKGGEDGAASDARFSSPEGVAVAADGTVYVADTGYFTIRKITPAGAVSTLAGASGLRGYADGTGAAARFWDPTGITVAGDGTLYVTDKDRNTIRKISPLGVVSTHAGSAVSANGTEDGPGISARFFRPRGLVVAGDGSLYVADSQNNVVRKVDATGQVSRYAGALPTYGTSGYVDGTGLIARFDEPQGMAVDRKGTCYVLSGCAIRKITATGVVTTLAGHPNLSGSIDGPGLTARFESFPQGIAVDEAGAAVYVADTGNGTIRKITSSGVVTTLAGLAKSSNPYQDGTGDVARFSFPEGIAVDGTGTVYVADTGNHVIRKITPAGVVSTFAGTPRAQGGADGTGLTASFLFPTAIVVDGDGTLYVVDRGNSAIRKITSSGVVSTFAGAAKQASGSVDGPGLVARFKSPQAVAIDSRKNLYVTDMGNGTIRKITPAGVVSTIGGMPFSTSDNAEGTGLLSRFDLPRGIAVEQSGKVLVTDSYNHRVVVGVPGRALPVILAQPTSKTVFVGSGVTLSVAATGGNLTYQWRKNGAPVSGATAPVYSISSFQFSDVGVYEVVITNGAGAVTSEVASLTLSTTTATPVTFTAQPAGVSVSPGLEVFLSVTTTGGAPLTYQWRKDGAVIVEATGSSYTIPAATLAAAGYYDVVVTNVAGMSFLSEPALVTVGGSTGLRAPRISTQPASLSVREGNSAEFTVTATGTAPLRYQWRKNGVPIPNANYFKYKILSVRSSDAGTYDVVLTNPVGTVTSSAAAVSLLTPANAVPVITEQPAAVAVYPGVSATFRVGVTGYPAPTFQWRKGGVPIAGGTSASYTIASAAAADAASYDVVVANAGGSVTSGAAALTLQALPKGAGEWFPLAGNPINSGIVNAKGPDARFWELHGITRDDLGNLYVIDDGSLRKITPEGVVSTIVNNQLNVDASGLARDSSGNFYVATGRVGGYVIKVSAAGLVSTLAGDPSARGNSDGKGGVARFNVLSGIAVMPNGVVYVVDTLNENIRKIMPDGTVTTVAGNILPQPSGGGYADGTGSAARFDRPLGITHDEAGNLYVADTYNNRIRKVTPQGVVTTVVTTGLWRPGDVSMDGAGNLYVADTGNQVVRKITPAGVLSTVAGISGIQGSNDGTALQAKFSYIPALVADPLGTLYVSDAGNRKIRKVSPGGDVTTVAGAGGVGAADGIGSAAQFNGPTGVAVDPAGNIFVTDVGNSSIRKVTRAGVVSTVKTGLDLSVSPGIAVDRNGDLLAVNNRGLVRVTKAGFVMNVAGSTTSNGEYVDGEASIARFNQIKGIVVLPDDTIYLSETRAGNSSGTIRKITPAGMVSAFVGSHLKTQSILDGPADVATFTDLWQLALSKSGNFYVADQFHCIRKVDLKGNVTTYSGGNAPVEGYWQPRGVAVDADEIVYVADTLNNRVRRVAKDGTITTIGTGFRSPHSIAVDPDGNLVLVDTGNSKLWTGVLKDVPLQLIQQPVGLVVTRGAQATFAAEVQGSIPLLFQWRKDGLPIAGATQPVYSIPSVQPADVGVYDLVITNGAGALTSAPAPLSLSTEATLPVTITAQPRDVVVNLSNPLELSVTATGTAPLTYQWRKDGVEIPSATVRTYSIPVVDLSSGGYYDVVVTNAAGSVLSEPALVEINGMGNVPPSIRTQPGSLQGVAGGFTTFTVAVAGSAPLSYQWRKEGTPISGATSAAYTLNGLRAADAGSYDVVVSNRAGSATSAAAVLTVNNPLAIVTPPAPLTVAAGNYAFFSVTASGTAPITYQWRKDGEPLEGGTASFFEIPAAQAVHAGSYDVVVANPGNSLTSSPAALTVQQGGGAQVALVAQPVNTGALPGGAASFSVSATGTAPISYQWRRNGVTIAGANGPVYAIGAVQASAVGSYDVVVGNWSGEVTSTKATLSLYSPVSITAHPLSRSVATGTAATFSVTATGTAPLAYQWRKNGQNIAGATQAAYTIGAAQAADEGVYDVVLTNPAGSALSNAAALGVGPKPVLVKGPSGATVLAGGSLTLSVSATGDGVTYQWRRNGSNIPGATAQVLMLRNVKAADGGRFEVVVANAYGAVSPVPAADVAVHVPVSFTRHPDSALLREGAAATLSVQATGTAPLAYQWRRNGAPIPGATRFSYAVSSASSETAGTYDVVVSNPAGAFVSNAAQISVSMALGIVRQPAGASVTQGSAVTLSVLAKGSGELKYAWYKWRDTGAPLLVGTLSSLSFPSAAPGDAGSYSVLVTGNGTPVFSDRVTVAVSSARGVVVLRQPEDASLAEGAAVGVRTVINAGGGEVQETRYTLCTLRNGVQVATDVNGVVPETGVLDVPLRRVNAGGAYVVRFERVYADGGTATAFTQPFYVSVRGRTQAVGTYEGLLVDANVEGIPTDGAGPRGCITVSLSKTGSVSGRVQYVEAGSLAGAPSAALRVYMPVLRSFSGVLVPSPSDPLKLVANLRLGVGSQAGRQELALVLDQSADEPLLTATVNDRVSVPGPAPSASVANGLRRNVSAAPARAVGRYALAAPPAAAVAGDNNAQLLVQLLPSGRALWASRLTGYSGSGSGGLTAPSATLLSAPLYEGRATVGATLLTTSALFGELRWAQVLDGGWDVALGADRLEQARSRVTGSRGMGGFTAAYSEAEFAARTNLSGVRVLDFGGAAGCRIQSTMLGTLFGLGAPGLTFVSADPLAGGSLGFRWNVTVSSAGVVRTSGISMGGVTPPVLSLRLDKVRGEWSGSYMTGGVRRSLIGCVLDSASSRGRGWFESGAAAGRWELRLGE
jgi:mucin-19